jgi:pimeloyl-ACP methyl ester carboxylesterase
MTDVNGARPAPLIHELVGEGDPMVLLPGGLSGWLSWIPFVKPLALHARSLLRHLGIDRAHIVGHSSSANIALQLALDAPEAVVTLTLLEPAARTARAARPREPRDWVQRSSGITLVTARAPSTHSCGL